VGLIGIGTHRTSISPTTAHTTPAAVRAALGKYSTWHASAGVDLQDLWGVDLGDVYEPDGGEGEARTIARVRQWSGRLLVGLGGDNSLTYAMALGVQAGGLITLDAHHDLRDGISNGSPVRRLVEAGLSGERIVQIGLADFSNSREYAQRARDYGITVVTRDDVARYGIDAVMNDALSVASAGGGCVHVDLDVDVCDRAAVPACPAAAPGGLSAWELRRSAFLAGRHPSVVSLDFAEVDAGADAQDQRTVRLVALGVLESAAGLAARRDCVREGA
jgi:formiminoglutamase